MRTSEVLNRAADLIEERGWTQGNEGWPGHGEGAALCLEGGIMAALGLTWREHNILEFWDCPAYRAVEAYTETHRAQNGNGLLWQFNDRVDAPSEVIEVLRATAIIEAAKEDEALAAEFLTWQGSEISA